MKYVPILFLLFYSLKLKAQNQDTLSKYSYLIIGYRGNYTYQNGTGFFLKTNEGYRFITAKHVVSGINTFNKKLLKGYDYIGIQYNDTVTKKSAIIRIDIRQIKPLLPNTFFYETPDIVVFDFRKLKLHTHINSIEAFIPSRKDTSKKLEKIIIYGYAKDVISKDADSLKIYRYEGSFADFSHIDPSDPKNDGINWIIQPDAKEGLSGSPVFLKYSKNRNGKKVEWFEFGGVEFGGNQNYNSAYIVRQNIAIKEIFKQTKFVVTF